VRHPYEDITRDDLARRYGYFLDHVQRSEGLDRNAGAAVYVTPIGLIVSLQNSSSRQFRHSLRFDLQTAPHGSAAALGQDFTWLTEIEKDLALVMQPRSKFDRLVTPTSWLKLA
jgi:hypothetical protein